MSFTAMRTSREKVEMLNAQLTIHTDILAPAVIKINSALLPPKIAAESRIDFGKTQFGGFSYKSITLFNPFSEPLTVYLYVGRTLFDDEYERAIHE